MDASKLYYLLTYKNKKIMVRAKFRCEQIADNSEGNGSRVLLRPVTCGSEENERFFNLTPYGLIEIGTVNLDSVKEFEIGSDYYVDFTKAD